MRNRTPAGVLTQLTLFHLLRNAIAQRFGGSVCHFYRQHSAVFKEELHTHLSVRARGHRACGQGLKGRRWLPSTVIGLLKQRDCHGRGQFSRDRFVFL